MCVLGCPLPPHIKEQGGGWPAPVGRAPSRIPTRNPIPSRFPTWGREGEGRRGREGRQGAPPLPCPIRTQGEGARHLPWPAPLSPIGPIEAHYFPGGSGNPPVLRFFPKTPGTLPVSEYSHPIYQSLCLDHFETPRHVRDHIRDSNNLRYIKIHKLIMKLSS